MVLILTLWTPMDGKCCSLFSLVWDFRYISGFYNQLYIYILYIVIVWLCLWWSQNIMLYTKLEIYLLHSFLLLSFAYIYVTGNLFFF